MTDSAAVTNTSMRDTTSSTPRAFIFDMDGVICDTMPFHIKAWQVYSQQIPELAHISLTQLETMGGKRNEDLLPELLGHPVAADLIQQWGAAKEAIYRDLIRGDIEWLPGLINFLQQARSLNFQMGLGTSACRENVDLLMGHQNLGTYFQAQVIETDVVRGKPDPQCYQLVAERLGVKPHHCLVFEDAVAGVQAARNAGMDCWGVLTTQSEAALTAAGATYCIQDFTNPRLSELLAASPISAK